MKLRNRIGMVVLSIGLLLSSLPSFAAGEGEAAENPAAEAAYNRMVQLGILSGEDAYEAGAPVTRGSFIRLALTVSGEAETVPAAEKQIFADVPPTAEDAVYIAAAYTLGYVSGDENGRFNPGAEITGAEALKLTLGILGYGPYAAENGGYPAGYLKIANRLGLTDGTGLDPAAPLTYDGVMVLLDNALDTDLMEITKIGETVEMQSQKDKNLLSERFSIYQSEAVISANQYTDLLAADSGLPDGEIIAAGERYLAGETRAADYLGYLVRLYYYQDQSGSTPVIRYFETVDRKNRTLTLKPDEVGTLSGTRLNYSLEGERQKEAVLSEEASLIWNGKMTELKPEKLELEAGEVVLISNDGDTVYDVILVMSYRTLVVAGVSASNYAVSPKSGMQAGEEASAKAADVRLDPEDPSYEVRIRKGGETVEFGAIAAMQVLSYAESESGEKTLKTVLISDKNVTGTVDQINEDSIVIGGTRYDAGKSILQSVKPGREGTFYLDAFERVVYIGGTLDIVYGYLNGISTGVFDEVICRIFTENNRWVTLNMRDRVKLNGQSVLASEAVKQLGKKPEEYRQLIRYLVDADGEIRTIDTAQTFTQGSEEERRAIDENTFRLTASGSLNYRSSTQTFDGVVTVGPSAKLFIVPAQARGSNEEGFDMVSSSELAPDTSYNFEAYEGNLVRTASVFVLNNYIKPLNSGNSISNVMIVEEFCQTLDADQTAAKGLRGYWKGLDFALPLASGVSGADQLKRGDIIQFSYNDDGEIDKIERKYQAGSVYSISGGVYGSSTFIGGRVVSIDASEQRAVIEYSAPNGAAKVGSTAVTSYSSGLEGIYIYEPSLKRYTSGTIADLMEGDLVFGTYRYLQCRELIIIRD